MSRITVKRSSYWRFKVTSERNSPRSVWRTFDEMMGRGRNPIRNSISARDFLHFFRTVNAGEPSFSRAPQNCVLSKLQPVSSTDVISYVFRLKNEYSICDPLPTSHLKCCICLLYTSPSPRDLSTSRMPSSA